MISYPFRLSSFPSTLSITLQRYLSCQNLLQSFVVEPSQIYSPRVPLHSIPPRPIPFPMDLDTTPSPFLLSSETFENGMGQDPNIAGDVSEDDKTPTTSPTTETGSVKMALLPRVHVLSSLLSIICHSLSCYRIAFVFVSPVVSFLPVYLMNGKPFIQSVSHPSSPDTSTTICLC